MCRILGTITVTNFNIFKYGFNSLTVNWMQDDLKSWFMEIVHDKEFIQSDLINNPLKLKNEIVKIVSKKDSCYSMVKNVGLNYPITYWIDLLNKDYKL